ncbi:winged helix-turn-helix domain-containing protein, partial [Streptomyces sp. NPDC001410]|uniref:helix-turn-helix domain-containing protein n=1 Tax=Streptomyces sp. NPDC001410 TaxID=3364574 RepID=UPI0036BEF940
TSNTSPNGTGASCVAHPVGVTRSVAVLKTLSEKQVARLERELEHGSLSHGWADQRWTLARIKALIGRLFHVPYTVEGTWRLLKRHGWSWQQPARRAIERDDDAVEVWRKETWPRVRASRRSAWPGSSSRTRPGSR